MTGQRDAGWRPEFSRPLDVGELQEGDEGRRHLEADADERAALCRRFELVAMAYLESDVSYARLGGMVELRGRLRAEVTQTCVVTLEPLVTAIDESFIIKFDPELDMDELDVMELSPDDLLDEEDVRPLVGDEIDLGEAVAECLGLAIEPYPRKDGSRIDARYVEAPETAGSETNPFAVLKKLKL
jgi:uncharacterized metal-binding protein YceD (DUF177 family)